jgi:tRNA(Ile)-lysidine synthase
LIQGTGLAGLRGIPPVNGALIRPLLYATKESMQRYASAHNLPFRTDTSNSEATYLRNKIRLEVFPKLLELNPGAVEALWGTAERLRQSHEIFRRAVEKQKRRLTTIQNGLLHINIRALRAHPAGETILFEILKDFGFNTAQSQEIFDASESLSGNVFFSDSHRVVKDRRYFVVTPKESVAFYHTFETGSGTFESPLGKLSLETIPNSPHINFDNVRYQYLDAGKLEFPLTIRPWRKGDYFYPFGLNKKKKISDAFTDRKMSLPEKEAQPLLLSGSHVVAVPGLAIDHRFRVTSSTQAVLKIFIQSANIG